MNTVVLCGVPVFLTLLVLWATGVLFPPPKPEPQRPTEAELAKAMMLALPDVLAVRTYEQKDTIVEVTIKGEEYDEAQMDRLIDAEMGFLEERPNCPLSFRYIPAAYATLAARKESPHA